MLTSEPFRCAFLSKWDDSNSSICNARLDTIRHVCLRERERESAYLKEFDVVAAVASVHSVCCAHDFLWCILLLMILIQRALLHVQSNRAQISTATVALQTTIIGATWGIVDICTIVSNRYEAKVKQQILELPLCESLH